MRIPDIPQIETILISIIGPTLSLMLDKMKNKKVSWVEVLFKYLAGVLCTYLAHRAGFSIWLVAIISIASSDIVKYILSEDGIKELKSFLMTLLRGK